MFLSVYFSDFRIFESEVLRERFGGWGYYLSMIVSRNFFSYLGFMIFIFIFNFGEIMGRGMLEKGKRKKKGYKGGNM